MSSTVAGGEQPTSPWWRLRYAPHLGYVPPELLQFSALAGSDPVNHVHFAAQQGFAGVLDPWIADRGLSQRDRIIHAIRSTHLVGGCIVATPRERLSTPLWVNDCSAAVSELTEHIQRRCEVAIQMRSSVLAVLVVGEPGADREFQKRIAVDRLRHAADLATTFGLTVAVEPMIRLPHMLLRTFAEGVELVKQAEHPALGLIYDTAHCRDMGDDPYEALKGGFDHIAVAQLADFPGRVEPGAGEIAFVPILAELMRRNFEGLVELEYNFATPGERSERSGLEALRQLDSAAAVMSTVTPQ